MKTSLRIIFADDKTNAAGDFTRAFEEMAIRTEVINITNGKILIDYLASELIKCPDAIFIDLSLPGKNGLDCLVEIKKIERIRRVPVFIYCTGFRNPILDLLHRHGAFYCIVKNKDGSFSKETVEKVIAAIVKSRPQPPREEFVISL